MNRRALLATALVTPFVGGCGPAGNLLPARPPTTGLDSVLLAQADAAAEALPKFRAMIVARDGERLFERAYRGPGLDVPVNIKSASKSLIAALGGIAIGKGVFEGVDQPISDFLADRFPTAPDPRLNQVTIGHLLSMQAGLGSTSGADYGQWVSSRDWVRSALARPFEADPGGRMVYSTGTSHLTSACLTRAAGRSTLALMREWLGEPLGIEAPSWPADPQGIYFGGNDMRLSPRALLTFGELYRNDGMHQGARVLPEGWVAASWHGRGTSRWSGNPYGYGWWIRRSGSHDVYFAWGYGGQMVFVVPDLNLTVVMTSDSSPADTRDGHVDALHALLDRTLIPAAERGAAA
ncbi:MAG: serine hydrolase domain-containing protein [Brevundimonas sp.]